MENSKEKQIEEMAKIFCGMKNGCDGCMWGKVHCNERNYAVEIYNAGYRKQSEGEWLVNAWSEKSQKWIVIPYIKHQHIDPFCSLCKSHALLDGAEFGVASNYCPNCGAKMKGGE